MGNKRNSRTTHPRKAARRVRALENFTLDRKRMNDQTYMARKSQEFLALGGAEGQLQYVPQRVASNV